jgi:hypothetical protein
MTLFSRTTVFALLAGALLLSACAGLQPTSQPVTITLLPGSPPPIASAPPITTIQPTTTPGAATAEIELTITGGPADGSYRAVVHGTSCIQPSADQFVANYADPVAVDGFTRLDIDVRDAAAAIDSETDDFALDLTVAGTSYSIDPSSGEGEGSALLEIDPLANATLDVFATAEDGVELELSLLCDVEPL